MHKTVGGRLHFASVSCLRLSPTLSYLAPRYSSKLSLQFSPSLQIVRDASCARAWAALQRVVLLHSSDDSTVPAASSIRLHQALASRGIYSRLLISTGSHCSPILGNGFVRACRRFCRNSNVQFVFSSCAAQLARGASCSDRLHKRRCLSLASCVQRVAMS